MKYLHYEDTFYHQSSYQDKGDIKRRNTLGCLDQYMCHVLRLWNNRDHETVEVYKYQQRIDTIKQSWLSGGYMVIMYFQ